MYCSPVLRCVCMQWRVDVLLPFESAKGKRWKKENKARKKGDHRGCGQNNARATLLRCVLWVCCVHVVLCAVCVLCGVCCAVCMLCAGCECVCVCHSKSCVGPVHVCCWHDDGFGDRHISHLARASLLFSLAVCLSFTLTGVSVLISLTG